LQEVGNSQYVNVLSNNYPFLCHYNTILRKADPNIPGMRGLSISVHHSCSFSPDPFEYKYIISFNITSFWRIKCTIGNTYVPMVTHKEERTNGFSEITNWIKKHTNIPSILVGDFNMSKSQLKSLLNKSSHQWFANNLTGLDFTWARDGRSSCIDHVLFNCKMKEYINKVSVCSTFNDISDHFPLILSCKKDDSEGFRAPTPSRRFKWSQHMCNEKHNEIFSSNYFSILLSEFDDNEELSSNEMVNKFIETANKVGDKVHARVPCDLKGSAFHCPYYIKKLSHEKHVAFYEIKKFSLGPNLENLDDFLNLLREYKNIFGKVRSIEFSIKLKQFHQSIESVCNDFRNKNARSAWLKLRKLSHPMYSNSISSSVLRESRVTFYISLHKY